MTIGYFAPLPPERSGVADYAAALLREMPGALPNRDGDVNLYQLGNNLLHSDIYRHSIERPGVSLLHDAVLQHFFLGSLDERQYVEEFVYNYGEWARDLALDLWRNRARSGSDPRSFEYPMLRRVAETARVVVVHNPAAAKAVARHAAQRRTPLSIVEIPHLFEAPAGLPSPSEVLRLRERWGLGPRTFLFGVFGYLRESKRLVNILRAFRTARAEGADVALLIAGEFVSEELRRATEPLLGQEGVHRVGHLPEHGFWLHAAAVDACLNLRYPTAGETSGIGVRLMGLGKPVLFTAGEELSRLPPAACIAIDSGPSEIAMISKMMLWLARFPRHAQEIGRRAAAHIGAHHAPNLCAQAFVTACHDCHAARDPEALPCG